MRFPPVHLPTSRYAVGLAIVLHTAIATEIANAEGPRTAEQLEQAYVTEVQPLVARYCHECHGAGDTVEADLDLAKLTTWAAVSREPETWQKVDEMLTGGLMPPEDADQPTQAEREAIEKWVHHCLALEAGSRTGDPGPVVLRRLSNAEYTYTLRDLTGVESLDPAREFPADGAAGEGFTNAGNALVMSPALVTKYLDAAKEVAGHAVLLPNGFRFSPHATSRDWTDDILAQIRAFYGRFTEAGGDHLVTQQGVALDVGQGGQIPLTQYIAATIAEREALTNGAKTIRSVARDRGLNAKYLGILWSSLTAPEPSILLDRLRRRWRGSHAGDEVALANEVAAWQKELWRFSGVGHIGRIGGPTKWLEPVSAPTVPYELPLWIPDVIHCDARARIESQLDEFRQLFPAALCYTKIVPVDEVVTITLFHREDEHLQRLMLDDAQVAELNRLWDELHFVSQDALQQVDVLEQVLEFATQDADPKAFEPLRAPTKERADAFRHKLVESEPKQLDALVAFAGRAYRRPLTDEESQGLRDLYDSLRREEIPHDEAFRLTLARILVAPAFLYRAETPSAGIEPMPVSDSELATRLSYFLWSSQPDGELRSLAAAGKLHEPETLVAQSRRMLRDAKARRLATEFACQWLHVYDFDELDEKSDRHYPTFVGLRAAMYEESIRFFTHLFNENAPVLDIVSADYTFLNEDLAKHYGISGVSGPEWRRVDSVKRYSRGGVLAQATTLAKQSGASRTSPILRGNWVSEVLLGEKLPRPPKGVPPLPDDEAAADALTVRQLVEKHVSDAKCAVCHARIDPYGFALENFDAIGRYREKDLADRPVDAKSHVSDGTPLDGLAGLQNYLLYDRRDAFLRQFCRKLLGYALGRGVQLSDEPLVAEMQMQLSANEFRVATAVETIVRSPQFREIRGRDAVVEK
jgi:hypothetical protein